MLSQWLSSDLPRPRRQARQRTLFETRLLTYGSCRTVSGDFFEEATAVYTRGARLRTDSRCEICPDLWLTGEYFAEVKSVGRTGEAIAYENRLRKDCEFVAREPGRQLYYWFWRHHFRVSEAQTADELRRGLAATLRWVLVVPLDTVRELLDQPAKLLNNSYARGHAVTGWAKRGYGYGWNVKLTQWLAAAADRVVDMPVVRVYDTHLPRVQVYLGRGVPVSLLDDKQRQRSLWHALTDEERPSV